MFWLWITLMWWCGGCDSRCQLAELDSVELVPAELAELAPASEEVVELPELAESELVGFSLAGVARLPESVT